MRYLDLVKTPQKYPHFVFGQAVSDSFSLYILFPLGGDDGE